MSTETELFIPMSVEAEQGLLGAILMNPEVLHDVSESLVADDFYVADHRVLFDVICQLADDNQIDAILVAEKAEARTGKNYLPLVVEMASSISGYSNAKAYANVIKDLSIKRGLLRYTSSVSEYVAKNRSASAAEAVNHANTMLTQLDNSQSKTNAVMTTSEAMKIFVAELDGRFKRGDELNGFSSGWPAIDFYTNGWKRKNLIIIAGRPSMGKTTYALHMAANMAASGLNGLFFSIEMSTNELMEKLTACVGKIPLDFLQNPSKYNSDAIWPKLQAAAQKIKQLRLKIIECPGIHINQIKAYARKAHRAEKLDFIFVDHMHIVRGDAKEREREIAQISWSLKALAGELDIPMFALAQLNRGVESRTDKTPKLSDLRDSGSAEQDADLVQLIYRPDYYNDDENDINFGLIQIETAKHRNGKKGKSTLGNAFAESRLIDTERKIGYAAPMALPNYTSKKLKAL